MTVNYSKRLYDVATRQQIYVEGVKTRQVKEFNFVLKELSEELKMLLGKVQYKTLDQLTKLQLNLLIASVRKTQNRIYSVYTTKLLKQLKDFMNVDLQVSRISMATVFKEMQFVDEDVKILSDDKSISLIEEQNKTNTFIPLFGIAAITKDSDRLWSAITNTPIPANGVYLQGLLNNFSISAQASVENMIRKAWANKESVRDTADAIAGPESRQGSATQLQRVRGQAAAVIDTAHAHVAALTAAAVASAMFGKYGWHSVIDSATTDICRHRNRKVYTYGNGPLPPAHIRCRSHTAPFVGNSDFAAETYYTWLMRQPDDIQNDALGLESAEALRTGELKAKDLPRAEIETPLTLAQFRAKVKEILQR